MAEFGIKATGLADPQAAGSTPHGGFNSPQIRTDVWQGLERKGEMAAAAVAGVASIFGESAGVNPILAKLTDTLSTLATGKESGKIGKSEADAKARLAAAEALRNSGGNPDLVEDIKKNVQTFTGVTALSTDESPEAKFERELQQSTIKGLKDLGFPVVANPSPDLMKSYNDAYATIKSSAAGVESQAKAIALAQSKFNYDQDVVKNSAANSTNDLISKNLPQFTETLRQTALSLREDIKSGKIDANQAMQQLAAQGEFYRGQLQTLAPVSPEYVKSTMSYLESYGATLKMYLDPKVEESTLQSEYNITTIKDRLFLNTFGNIRAYNALEPLVRNNPLMYQSLNDTVMAAAVKLSNSFDSSVTPNVQPSAMSQSDRKSMYGVGTNAIKSAMSTLRDQQTGKTDLGTDTTNNIVNNLLVASANVSPNEKVSTSKEFVDFLASNEFKVWRQKGELNSEALSAAQNMFDTQYLRGIQQPIINKLNQTIAPNMSTGGFNTGSKPGNVTYKDTLKVEFKNGIVSFSPRPAAGEDTRQMMAGRAFASDVKQLESVVNTLVRAGANIRNIPVDQYWEENKSNILPIYFPPNAPDIKVGDVHNGYEYVGGAVNSKSSWRKTNAGQSGE